MHFQVLVHHGNHANRKVPGNTTADLEEADTFFITVVFIIIGQPNHVFDSTFHCTRLDLTLIYIRSKDVTPGAVFPSANNNRQVLFSSSDHPTILWIYLVVSLHYFAQ